MSGSPRFYDYRPAPADLRAEVLAGLTARPKVLPPKLFYDQTGSSLFEAITRQPEYYLTRAEWQILMHHGEDIAQHLGSSPDRICLIELGSGSAKKTEALLDVLPGLGAYCGVDISGEYLLHVVERLALRYPKTEFAAIVADYSEPFPLPAETRDLRRVLLFLGSSLGNFEPHAARSWLQAWGRRLYPGDAFLLGVDRKKDPSILNRAYNDRAGYTARFNLNVLTRLNRDLGTSFDVERFRHLAWYNADCGRIEMYLESLGDQTVRISDHNIFVAGGERIHTENSYKYSPDEVQNMAREAGWRLKAQWHDPEQLFGLYLLQLPDSRPR